MANKNIPTIQTIRGNVGIGTTSPASKLDVTGTIRSSYDSTKYLQLESNSSGGVVKGVGGNGFFIRSYGASYFNGGNVGIGTTSPGVKLHVTGEVRAYDSSNTYYANLNANSSWGYFNTNASRVYINKEVRVDTGLIGSYNEALQLRTSGTTRMYINNSTGNVGIGTTSPGAKLHVDGTAIFDTQTGAQPFYITRDGATNQALKIYVDDSTAVFESIQDETANGYGSFDFKLDAGVTEPYFDIDKNNTNLFRVNGNGNVGIGTTSPGYKLDVNGSFRGGGIQADSGATIFTYNEQRVLYGSLSAGSVPASYEYSVANSGIVSDFPPSEAIRIDSSGNVGIGTTSPNKPLTIQTNDSSWGSMRIYRDSATLGETAIGFFGTSTQATNQAWVIGEGGWGNSGDFVIGNENGGAGGNVRMLIQRDGSVGIGTVSPGQKLDVAGNIECNTLYLNNASSLYFLPTYFGQRIKANCQGLLVQNGSTYYAVYASAFSVQSDYRLKSNIVPLDNAIDRLKQIPVHRFNWNDRLNEPKVDGFIAHELSEVVPEAVLGEKDAIKEDGTPDYQGIDQSKIVPLLTAALQDAITKIEQLETRIQTLENNG